MPSLNTEPRLKAARATQVNLLSRTSMHRDASCTRTSSWRVLSKNISVGKPFYVLLTALDCSGNISEAGDFYKAMLTSGTKTLMISVGHVTDYNNGSYLITFVPYWSGVANIHIELVLTSRVIKLIQNTTKSGYIMQCSFHNDFGFANSHYVGPHHMNKIKLVVKLALKNGRGQNELGLCYMDSQVNLLPHFSKSCDMRFPSQHRFYGVCQGSHSTNSTFCESLHWCIRDQKMFENLDNEKDVIQKNTGIVLGDVKSVYVANDANSLEKVTSKTPCLPQPVVKPTGYWMGRYWKNSNCLFGCDTVSKWWSCLTGRDLYMIGSVGVRVALKGQFVPPKLQDHVVEQYNTTVHFNLHGPPIASSSAINFSLATFTADVIDAIPANGNEILVISTVHHFLSLSVEGFQQRLMDIVAAIRRLRQRKLGKKILIIFRTANPRGGTTFRRNPYRLKRYSQMAIDTLVAAKQDVIVYDIFDMFLAYPGKAMVHLPDDMMTLQMNHILSLVCPLKS
ncbi:NXPE family member 4-like [Corticium candelabrum]|uniref:NXPE family member 4-like n=1 Tax=Corticium candelabrum TaxID=121492 RepID=UPI002E26012D|nr:NXPE family member 4-like [Corticium candelabrum]